MNSDSKIKILTADWILPIASEPIKNGAIAIKADKIVAAGERFEIQSQFSEARIENFGAAAILPGFVNAHTHLELTAMRGFLDDVEADFFQWLRKLTVARAEKMTNEDLRASTICGAIEAARAGIVCLADIATNSAESFDALQTIGLRGVVYQEVLGPDANQAELRIERAREQINSCRARENSLVKIGITPHAPYSVSPKLFKFVTDLALAENLPVTIHAAESANEIEFLRTGKGFFSGFYEANKIEWQAPGVSPIEYLKSLGVLEAAPLLAHCVCVSAKDLEIIAETDSRVVHCPKSNAKFSHGVAPFAEFLAKNIPIGLGSDSVASNNVADILEEARFAALLARGNGNFVSAEDVLFAATLGGARALNLENETGTLEVGKQADLIVVNLARIPPEPIHSPVAALVFASSSRDVVLTMVAGTPIFERGKITRTDENHWRSELKKTASKFYE